MSTAIYTRRLVEHRYGRPLEELRRGNASGHSDDPVLPILLRRLGGLIQTDADVRSARRNLDTAWQRCRSGEHVLDDLVLLYATEVVDLERQEQSEAEAVWDLLDVRLLLDRPSAQQPPAHRAAHAPDDQDLLTIAREVAVGLQRLNLRHCVGACATAASTSATAASARCSRGSAPRAPPTELCLTTYPQTSLPLTEFAPCPPPYNPPPPRSARSLPSASRTRCP